mmetsp:Transcript_67607/g.133432  ORF Transcript_67607/g.133432 Transcript_67607/m.133432 type:complete len:231 (+) Transcript_67607:633-1325(+)
MPVSAENTTPTTSSEVLDKAPTASSVCGRSVAAIALLPRPAELPLTRSRKPPARVQSGGLLVASTMRRSADKSPSSNGLPSSSVSSRGKPSTSQLMASPSISSVALLELLNCMVIEEPAAAERACSFSCEWSSYVTRRSISHSLRTSSSERSFEASRCEVDERRPRVRHIFSSCEKCCRRQSKSFGASHAGSRELSSFAARDLRRLTPTQSAASRPRTNCGAKRPQSSQM